MFYSHQLRLLYLNKHHQLRLHQLLLKNLFRKDLLYDHQKIQILLLKQILLFLRKAYFYTTPIMRTVFEMLEL